MQPSLAFLVRPALPEDAVAIGTIHTESWKTTYHGIIHQTFLDAIDLSQRIQRAEQRIKDPSIDNLVLLAGDGKDLDSGKAVGFADVGPCREKNVDADGEIYAIYLLQNYQNRGGGKILFEAGLAKCIDRGFQRILVSVLTENMGSRKFYEKMGGVAIGTDHVDIEDHRYPTTSYIWQLP